MEYFGRNLFVMNILQTVTVRKNVKTKELSPGNGGGGGTPPRKERNSEQDSEQGRERTQNFPPHYRLEAHPMPVPEPHPSEPRTELQKAP
jgi:hypothetical protein